MSKAIQIRVDDKLKRDADKVFDEIGLDAPTAIRLFLKKVVVTRSIPFDLKSGLTENSFTPEFENEVVKASKEIGLVGPFKSAKAAIAELHKHIKK